MTRPGEAAAAELVIAAIEATRDPLSPDPGWTDAAIDAAREGVGAAYPVIERAVRERIASEIEARLTGVREMWRTDVKWSPTVYHLERTVDIARGYGDGRWPDLPDA